MEMLINLGGINKMEESTSESNSKQIKTQALASTQAHFVDGFGIPEVSGHLRNRSAR
jgi:hypothetical protein